MIWITAVNGVPVPGWENQRANTPAKHPPKETEFDRYLKDELNKLKEVTDGNTRETCKA